MPSTIYSNIPSLNAQRYLSNSQDLMSTTMQRLSSGLRVNSAKDDTAGLSIATRMNSQIRGMNVAIRNANDGISLAQTAEGSLGKAGDLLQRMRELAVQASNGSNSQEDKDSLNTEYAELAKEVVRVFEATNFNGIKMLADDAGTLSFQVGANTADENQVDVKTEDMTDSDEITDVTGKAAVEASLGADGVSGGGDDVAAEAAVPASEINGTAAEILAVIDDIDTAIKFVSTQRSVLGAAQTRFDNAISYLQISTENTSASRSRIMDADYAQETANLSRAQILTQAGNAMVAQANQQPQSVLSLLRG
jgi:flagellin